MTVSPASIAPTAIRRGRSAPPGAIPIVVVTGALGAGKTTLVRRLLDSPEGADSAVIVNEFSDLGIDQHLLGREDVALLANGCFCCRQGGSLTRALLRLFEARRAGRMPDFRRVVVETSGIGDPAAILLSVAADEAAARLFFVQTIVTLVDATLASGDALAAEEARRRIMLADLLAITKADLAGPDAADRVHMALSALAPGVPILTAWDGLLDPDAVLGRAERAKPPPFTLRPPRHDRGVNRHNIVRAEPIDLAAFLIAMEALAALRGPDILRVKGLLHVHGRDRPLVYHRVQHIAQAPTELAAWPGEVATQLVFITRDVPARALDALIDALAALAMPSPNTPNQTEDQDG